jgi:tetratricopeptide (TPR) repeat protein
LARFCCSLCCALFRLPTAGFLGAWILLTLAPSSSIVPIATEVGAERRMYLPLMALVASGVLAACRLSVVRRLGSRSSAVPALVMATAALAALTFARNREHSSALTLAQTTLACWPSPAAHGMVGAELAALGRDDEALPALRAAAAGDPRARFSLRITLLNLRDDDGAIRELAAFAHEHPLREEAPLAHRAMGNAYARQRKWPDAVRDYRLVLAMTPSGVATRRLLTDALIDQGQSLGSAGRFGDAISAFRQALELEASNVIARHGLATALDDSGDVAGALAEARLAVGATPGTQRRTISSAARWRCRADTTKRWNSCSGRCGSVPRTAAFRTI